MKYFWPILLLFCSPSWAREKLYTDATAARIGPIALGKLHGLRSAGVVEILVPSWLPADLKNLRVKVAESKADRFGPSLEMEWPASNPHRGLVARGASGGFGGPGPDYTVPVANPTLGTLDLWVCDKAPFSARYCTDWVKVPGSMPKLPKDRSYYVDFTCVGKYSDSLSGDEMKRIVGSLRYFRIP